MQTETKNEIERNPNKTTRNISIVILWTEHRHRDTWQMTNVWPIDTRQMYCRKNVDRLQSDVFVCHVVKCNSIVIAELSSLSAVINRSIEPNELPEFLWLDWLQTNWSKEFPLVGLCADIFHDACSVTSAQRHASRMGFNRYNLIDKEWCNVNWHYFFFFIKFFPLWPR